MLGYGTHHKQVPRDLLKNLALRRRLLAEASHDRAVQRRLVQMCKEDVIFYTCAFCWQFNPSKRGSAAIEPFITFPVQERLLVARPETHPEWSPHNRGMLWCYENDRTLAVEKSRWQGASWLQLIFQDWLCLFHEYVQVLNVSRNEAAVDDGTKDSLFWKLRYMHDRLPVWMTGRIETSKLYFHYFKTDSEVTGTAATAKAGVGGRSSLLNVDEYPEIEKAQEVREKTALTSNCRIFTGTHLGVGTPFQKMCDPKQSPEIVRFQLHWTENPQQNAGMYEFDPKRPGIPRILDTSFEYPEDFKFVLDGSPVGGPRPGVRSPWYDQKCLEIGDARAVAMNLDISPEGAAKQFFDGLKIRTIVGESARPPVWVGDILHDKRGRLLGITETSEGRLKLWVRPKADGKLPAARYTIGTDISAGTGATPSCAAGINGDVSLKVLEYANPFIVEAEFAALVCALCEFMPGLDGSGAYLGWDSSGQQGTKFEQAILDLGYRNIYCNEDDLVKYTTGRVSRRPGWYGSNKQKYALLVDYRQALYERLLIDRSEECLLETLLFEYDRKTNTVQHARSTKTNDPSGARENHGDMVIATGIAWMLAKDWAEGGRKSPEVRGERVEPNTLAWLLALQEGRRRQLEEAY